MFYPILRRTLNALMLAGLCVSAAARANDCSAEIQMIDERIATGKYTAQQVQMAQALRGSMQQMCAFLDDKSRQKMADNIEDFLPTMSKEERRAERRQRSKETQARRVATELAEQDVAPPDMSRARAVAAGKGQYVDRNDDMDSLLIWDWDVFRGKARILYTTVPSLPQLGRPDWAQYVYVVEVAKDGTPTQTLVTSKQAQDHAALALRRGHDEIFFERHGEERGASRSLEVWSISGKRRLSSLRPPNPAGPDNKQMDWQPFRGATEDGNVMFVSSLYPNVVVPTVAWFKAAPDGRVMGQGSISSDHDDIGYTNWIQSDRGPGSIIYTAKLRRGEGEGGIRSAVPTPLKREIGGRQIQGMVGFERRMLVPGADVSTAWESPAVVRKMAWTGDIGIPNDLSYEERMRQSDEYREITQAAEIEYHAGRKPVGINVGYHETRMIKPSGSGFQMLADVTADRRLQPPIHGPWLTSIEGDEIHEIAYLNPLAELLDVKFEAFTPHRDGGAYLYGMPDQRVHDSRRVVLIDAQGEVVAHSITPGNAPTYVAGLLRDDTGVWVYGWGSAEKEKVRAWVERVEFSQ